MLNKALWRKAVSDVRLLLASLVTLLFVFNWLFVYLTSMIKLDPLAEFLGSLDPSWERLSGIPFANVATPIGRISMAYVDPVVVFATGMWGIGRGSDAVSGEIGRGTMEMLLAQPVRRVAVLATQAIVTTAGSALLAVAALLGTTAGLATVALPSSVAWTEFVPGAINLFAVTFFLAGFSTMISSGDDHRWRTIGLVGGFYMVQLVVKVIGRLVARYEWFLNFTFLTAFEPQALIIDAQQSWALSLRYNGALLGLGLASYVVAAVIFCRRDLPAPL